jgi:hypothetical protein
MPRGHLSDVNLSYQREFPKKQNRFLAFANIFRKSEDMKMAFERHIKYEAYRIFDIDIFVHLRNF